jgi:hypothetical protein
VRKRKYGAEFGHDRWMLADGLPLGDGRYDALVVDASAEGDTVALDLTILGGSHKGEVVSIRAQGAERGALAQIDELDLLGLPGTLVVENGVPAFAVER